MADKKIIFLIAVLFIFLTCSGCATIRHPENFPAGEGGVKIYPLLALSGRGLDKSDFIVYI